MEATAVASTAGLRRAARSGRRRRQLIDRLMAWVSLSCLALAMLPLAAILAFVGVAGARALDWAFLTQLPKPVGMAGGGMANAIVGTGILVGLASLLSIPVGVLAGVYLAEYGRGPFGAVVRWVTDLLHGVPSIVVGVVVYTLVVVPMGRFSALAGGIALAILMVPLIARTTEEMMRAVPRSLREAGLALGLPAWRVTVSIVLRTAFGGVQTGILLAIARAAGETAPLLFTALNNRYWSLALDQPMASLTVTLYTYAISPYEEWHAQAWAGALVLMTLVLLLNLGARLFSRRYRRYGG